MRSMYTVSSSAFLMKVHGIDGPHDLSATISETNAKYIIRIIYKNIQAPNCTCREGSMGLKSRLSLFVFLLSDSFYSTIWRIRIVIMIYVNQSTWEFDHSFPELSWWFIFWGESLLVFLWYHIAWDGAVLTLLFLTNIHYLAPTIR